MGTFTTGLFHADECSSLQSTNIQSDSCMIEMEPLCHLTSKNVSPNSRITFQRNLSRKGSFGGTEKMNLNDDGENNASNFVPISSSPKADQLVDSSKPEEPIIVTVGTTNHHFNQQNHQQITITTPATTESKLANRRNSFKRSSSWTFDPRRVLLFFATLSSIGTILLIYLTLSIKNVTGDAETMGQ